MKKIKILSSALLVSLLASGAASPLSPLQISALAAARAGASLPATGGIGTGPFIIVGVALMLGAVIVKVVIDKKKK